MTFTEILIKLLKEKIQAEGKETIIKQFIKHLPKTPKGKALKLRITDVINRLASEII